MKHGSDFATLLAVELLQTFTCHQSLYFQLEKLQHKFNAGYRQNTQGISTVKPGYIRNYFPFNTLDIDEFEVPKSEMIE